MIPVNQSKVTIFNEAGDMVQKGNCFAACIASIMERSITDVINIEELYCLPDWNKILIRWLRKQGWKWENNSNFNYFHKLQDLNTVACRKFQYANADQIYLVSGLTVRSAQYNLHHVCIYKNGKLLHDPHPSKAGLITFEIFETIKPL